AAWSELPRAQVATNGGVSARRRAASAATASWLRRSCAATTSAACAASRNIRVWSCAGRAMAGSGLVGGWRSGAGARQRRRAGGAAHHQLRHEALVGQAQRVFGVRVLAQAADQQPRGMAGDVLGGLLGGGQRRPGLARERAVLESGD